MSLFLFLAVIFHHRGSHKKINNFADRDEHLDPLASALLSAFSGGEVEEFALQCESRVWVKVFFFDWETVSCKRLGKCGGLGVQEVLVFFFAWVRM